MGHEPVLLPLARAVHDLATLREALRQDCDSLAISSAEAVRALGQLGSDALLRHLEMPLFAVGEASAGAAAALGFTKVVASHGDGAALGDLVAALSPKPAHLLYLAGNPRSQGFERRLNAAEVPFQVCEAYRMEPIIPNETALQDAFLSLAADAVLLYSAQTARRFFSLALFQTHPALLATLRILCLSEAIAAEVPLSQRTKTAIAARPDEENLLALL